MRLLAVLLLSVAVAGAWSPAGAAEREPGLDSAYLVGLDIHTPDGEVVHVSVPQRLADSTWLLGETDRGWVVGARCGYYLVSADATTRIGDRLCRGIDHNELLSDDGLHIVRTQRDLSLATVVAIDLDGNTSPETAIHANAASVDDAKAGLAYVTGLRGLFEVDLVTGESTRTMTQKTSLIDLESDTLFVRGRKRHDTWGPTSLAEPGPPRWQRIFTATDVSPNGTYVLGDLLSNGARRIQVFRSSDGRRVRGLPYPSKKYAYDAYFYDVIGWDSDRSVVMVKEFGTRRAIVRCPVPKGRCARVTPRTDLAVSLPTSTMGAHRYDDLD